MQNNSNKNWENKGWEAMQQMLDNELPTDKKEPKRRVFVWAWAAGFALIISAAATVFWLGESDSNFEKRNRSIADNATQELVEKPSETVNVDNVKLDVENEEIITKIEGKTIGGVKKSSLIEKSENDFDKSQNVDSQIFIKNENEKTIEQKFLIAEKEHEELNIVDNSGLNVDNLKSTASNFPKLAEESSNTPPVVVQNKRSDLFAQLPIQSMDLAVSKPEIFEFSTLEFPDATTEISKKKKRNHSFNLTTGMLVNSDFRANGFEAGALVNLPIKNSKFSLETGLNYRFSKHRKIRQNWSIFNNASSSDRESSLDGIGFGQNIDTTFVPNGVTAIAEDYFYNKSSEQIESFQSFSYHFLSVPINVNYHFHPKWSAFAGVETSMLLNFLNKNPEAGLLFDLDGNAHDPAFSAPNRFPLKNFDVAFAGGIKFQPTKHWNVRLKYHLGNLFQGDNWQVDNRFLSVGGGFVF